MHNVIKKIKLENELLKKKSADKYFENKIIDNELKFYNQLQNLKKNNCLITISGSLLVSICIFLGIHQSFDISNIVDISLLVGSCATAVGVGYGVANSINNKLLSDLDLDCNAVDEKENELLNRRNDNIKLIDHVNRKLMINNDEIERIRNSGKKELIVSNSVVDKKERKLVLKKMI